jgi:predicted GIY-YIG superfamily endonuclease
MNTAYIYRIRCKTPAIKEVYIGSTYNFNKRLIRHKSACKFLHNKLYNYINANGGWDNWHMEKLLQYEPNNKIDLLLKERQYIENEEYKLNQRKPYISKQEKIAYNSRLGRQQKICECGCNISNRNYARHKKSKIHKLNILTQIALSPANLPTPTSQSI